MLDVCRATVNLFCEVWEGVRGVRGVCGECVCVCVGGGGGDVCVCKSNGGVREIQTKEELVHIHSSNGILLHTHIHVSLCTHYNLLATQFTSSCHHSIHYHLAPFSLLLGWRMPNIITT